jgi:hypothetical protein
VRGQPLGDDPPPVDLRLLRCLCDF